MGPAVARRRDDFIGKRSLGLSFAHHEDREQLVGMMEVDGRIEVGARVLAPRFSSPPCPTEGYVTSACRSPAAGTTIGLALVERGFERRGEEVSLYSMGRIARARIVAPVFYDPANERVRM
jgi:sarcosine oxidase subunit alpha